MFNEKTIEQVWTLARTVEGFNPDIIRKDACGAWIMKSQYGNRDSIYGWEIDHVYPLSMGGTDEMANLRAMQWENNVAKGDDYPVYKSKIQAEGNKNISIHYGSTDFCLFYKFAIYRYFNLVCTL